MAKKPKHKCSECDFCEQKKHNFYCWHTHSFVEPEKDACNDFVKHKDETKKKGR